MKETKMQTREYSQSDLDIEYKDPLDQGPTYIEIE